MHFIKRGEVMKDSELTYAVSYLKTLENKMLTASDFETLISGSYDDAIKLLQDKGFGKKDSTDSSILDDEAEKIWAEAEGVLPDPAVLDILKCKNDFHNLKTILKAFITNMSWENLVLTPSIINPEDIYSAVASNDFSGLPEFLSEVGKNAYGIITKEHDGQKAEIYIDKMAFSYMKKLSGSNAFLTEWVDKNILFINILIAMRCHRLGSISADSAFIETDSDILLDLKTASETGDFGEILKKVGYAHEEDNIDIGEFEKWCEKKKSELFEVYKNHFFGIEPIFSFILSKEEEIKKVRIILSCLKNSIPTEIIRKRL